VGQRLALVPCAAGHVSRTTASFPCVIDYAALIDAWPLRRAESAPHGGWREISQTDRMRWVVGWRSRDVRRQDHRVSEQAQGKTVLR
jgi:hypothetical protein